MRFFSIIPFFVFAYLLTPLSTKSYHAEQRGNFIDGLFESGDVLNIKLSGNLKDLFNDESDNAKYHDITLSYTAKDGNAISIPIRSKTRGNFRRKLGDCTYPPIWLDFSENKNVPASLFSGQVKLKLVMPCRSDELVVREYLLYKLYNLITPESFRARLVKVETDDTKRNKQAQPFFGMLLEDDKQMAKRNHLKLIKRTGLKMQYTDKDAFLKMAVFEYLIGNTDWSVEYQQNIRLLAEDSLSVPIPVPYDFDQSGLVYAPYAQPAEELKMSSVRERRYRGYCVNNIKEFDSVVTFYNDLKKDIYSVYTNCSLISPKYLKETIKYLDQFYSTINNPKKLQVEFGYPCRPDGTGNVIIKGLNSD